MGASDSKPEPPPPIPLRPTQPPPTPQPPIATPPVPPSGQVDGTNVVLPHAGQQYNCHMTNGPNNTFLFACTR